ncbi:hypothetical protein HMPREF1548_05707 [Clostridium sp. KLE 1755]|nr:hypothetical protein HMPREF1548_05707 [Clostridium sp. KLE 1755]
MWLIHLFIHDKISITLNMILMISTVLFNVSSVVQKIKLYYFRIS